VCYRRSFRLHQGATPFLRWAGPGLIRADQFLNCGCSRGRPLVANAAPLPGSSTANRSRPPKAADHEAIMPPRKSKAEAPYPCGAHKRRSFPTPLIPSREYNLVSRHCTRQAAAGYQGRSPWLVDVVVHPAGIPGLRWAGIVIQAIHNLVSWLRGCAICLPTRSRRPQHESWPDLGTGQSDHYRFSPFSGAQVVRTRLWGRSHYWMWGAASYAFASSHSFLARVGGADRLGVELCHVLRLHLVPEAAMAGWRSRLFSS